MFAAQAASACHWNWTAVGNYQRPTEGNCPFVRDYLGEPVPESKQVWTLRKQETVSGSGIS